MTHLRLCIPVFLILLTTCLEAPTSTRSASTSSTTTELVAATPAFATGDVLLLKLDAKTSIPYDERDRTDEHFFHGFRILKSVRVDDVNGTRRLANLVPGAGLAQWRRDLVRDADYGMRMNRPNGNDDLLLCMHCDPPAVARPADDSETDLPASNAVLLREILTSAFENSH